MVLGGGLRFEIALNRASQTFYMGLRSVEFTWLANSYGKHPHSVELFRPEELCGLALSSIKMNSMTHTPLKCHT
ncbi:hypothetical protein TNCV_4944941 [Trichonephila clavipes]|nr:hypothetical protein TNCV_4944941 [Trichonephila clavipes]